MTIPTNTKDPRKSQRWLVATIALVVTVGFFGVIGLLCFITPAPGLKETVFTLVGQCSSGFILVLSYYFGAMDKGK